MYDSNRSIFFWQSSGTACLPFKILSGGDCIQKWLSRNLNQIIHLRQLPLIFRLSNAPASFQGYINKIFAEKLDIFVIVNLNDILIYTEDPGQPHVEAVRWVLDQLRKNSLFANLKKCRFHQDEVWFLGFVVSAQGIRMEEERIEAVKTWPDAGTGSGNLVVV